MASLFLLDFFPSVNTKLTVKTVLCTQTPTVFLDLSSGCDFIDLLYASCITGCWLTPAPSPRVDKLLVLEKAE